MSFNGAGAFAINTSGQPVVTGTTISSTVFNALTADLATGLSTAILKDGTQTTTARIPFAAGISSTLATDATSTTTGSIITAGGISAVKALWVGGLANIAGAMTLQSTLAVTTSIQAPLYYLGGTTSSEVSLRRSTTSLLVKLGDDSAYASLLAADVTVTNGNLFFAGGTSSDIRLVKSTTTLLVRLGDDSGYAGLAAASVNGTAITAASGLYLVGAGVNDVLLSKSATNRLSVRKGDDSGFSQLFCSDLQTSESVLIGSSILYFGGTTSSEVSILRSGTTLSFRKGDNSDWAAINCGVITPSNGLTQTFNPNSLTSMVFVGGILTAVV